MANYAKKLRKIIRKQRYTDAKQMFDTFWLSVERTGFWLRLSLCFRIMGYRRIK